MISSQFRQRYLRIVEIFMQQLSGQRKKTADEHGAKSEYLKPIKNGNPQKNDSFHGCSESLSKH